MNASRMGAFLSCGILWGRRRGKRNAGEGVCHSSGDARAVGAFFAATAGPLAIDARPWGDGLPAAPARLRREHVFPGVDPHSSRRMAFRPRRVQQAAGWACPAGRNSRRSTSIRHPRKEALSPCPAALARRKGRHRTAAPPPAQEGQLRRLCRNAEAEDEQKQAEAFHGIPSLVCVRAAGVGKRGLLRPGRGGAARSWALGARGRGCFS